MPEIPGMNKLLGVLLALPLTNSAFGANDWNCKAGANGNDWRCAASRPPADKAPEPVPANSSSTQDAAVPAAPPADALQFPSHAPTPRAAVNPVTEGSAAVASATPNPPLRKKKYDQVPEMKPSTYRGGKAPSAGWNCRRGEDGKEWNCALIGPDPRGETHVVREPDDTIQNWAETTDITEEDERRFRYLASTLPSNPWALYCGKREDYRGSDFLLSPADRSAREKAPLEITSDYGELHGGEVANFSGAARVTRADQSLYGDLLSRHAWANTMSANGSVTYQEKGMSFSSDSGYLDLGNDQGVLRNSQFILSTVPARGTSRVTYFDSKDLSRYEQFTYTACPPGNRDWMMHADNVKINKETGQGTAKHAWMEFKGVPFLYSPLMTFPVDDRRQSGFLAPSFGYSQVRGFDLTIPYYFNLAPNYDLTVWPRLLTNRGVLLHGDFRYLTPYNQGRLIAEVLPDDWETHTTRGEVGFLDNAWLAENFRTHVDLNYVSDQNYLQQLGNQLALIDFNYVRSNATATYTGSNWGLSSAVDTFQTINPAIPEINQPYFRLPSFNGYYSTGIADTGLNFFTTGEIVNYYHTTNVDGQRLNLRPRLQYPLRSAAGFVVPSLTLQMTQYTLQQQAEGKPTSPNRTLPIASIDSGLFFERDVTLGSSTYTHTLEPRLFYVYIPYQNQDDFPLFDTINYDFNYTQLFRENRFTGADRLGDTNQVTTALTSRLADQSSGRERLRATFGQIYYFAPRRVALPGFEPESAALSNLIGDVTAQLTDRWSLNVAGQWSPYEQDPSDGNVTGATQFQRRQISLHYGGANNELFNVGYLYLNQPQNQDFRVDLIDTSARLPIPWTEGWHAIGRWQYSLLTDTTLEAFLGLERETCCWRFTILGRHYVNNITATGQVNSGQFTASANNAVFMQFELKGLTRIGDQIEKLLYRSIRGYRIPEQ